MSASAAAVVPSMLTPPQEFGDVSSLGGAARQIQRLQTMAASATVADAKKARKKRRVKKTRTPSKSAGEILKEVGTKMAEAAEKVKGATKDALKKSADTIVKPLSGLGGRKAETETYLAKLEEALAILDTEPFHTNYNYYAANLPGLNHAGPSDAPRDLPVDYFDELNVPPSDQQATVKEAPGQFLRGEEQQYEAAVREFYQGMIDRIYEMWTGLKAALEDTKTWSAWASSWITQPLVINQEEAQGLLAALELALEKLCTGNTAQEACQIRRVQKQSAFLSGMKLDLNELWLKNCPATAAAGGDDGAYVINSLLCGLGRGSPAAQLVTRLQVVPVPGDTRDKRSDLVITILNAILGMVLSPRDYYQELIDDMATFLPPDLTEAEKNEKLAYMAKRDTASADAPIPAIAASPLIKSVRVAKKERLLGRAYSLENFDRIVAVLDTVLQSDKLREVANTYARPFGLEIPRK